MNKDTKILIGIVAFALAAIGFFGWLYVEMKPFAKPDVNMVIVEKETSFTAMLGDDIKALVTITITDFTVDVNDILRMRKEIRELLYFYTSDQIVSSSIAIIEKLRPIRDASSMTGLTFNIKFKPTKGEMFILEL